MNPLEWITSQAWAMQESAQRRMVEVIAARTASKLDIDEIRAIVEAAGPRKSEADAKRDRLYTVAGSVAVVDIKGTISRYASAFSNISGPRGTSVERISQQIAALREDDLVSSILLDIDSPGGAVTGLADVVDELRALGKEKPIVAYTGAGMHSAAFWLGSQAEMIVVGQNGMVGSIGIVWSTWDSSRAGANEGVELRIVKTGELKGRDAATGAIGEGLLNEIRAMNEGYLESFVAAVLRGRGMSRKALEPLLDGRSLMGQAAVDAKLADSVGTFQDALELAGAAAPQKSSRRGAPNAPPTFASHGGNMAENEKSVPAPDSGNTQATTPAETVATATTPAAPPAPSASSQPSMQEALEAERKRTSAIFAAALPAQRELAQALVNGGVSVEDAQASLKRDAKTRMEAANDTLGVDTIDDDAPAATAKQAAPKVADMEPEAQFKASKYLQDKYGKASYWRGATKDPSPRGKAEVEADLEAAQKALGGE